MRVLSGSDILFHGVLAATLLLGVAVFIAEGLHPAWGLLAIPAVGAYGALAFRKAFRRSRLRREPFPGEWRRFLEKEVPYYRALEGRKRERFERDVRYFLAERRFEGVGVELTDGIRLLIAAGAAAILNGRPAWELPSNRTFLVYPETFDERFRFRRDGPLMGEVSGQGPVIISLGALYDGWRRPGDGNNVAVHEIAHLLDVKGGGCDGVPTMLRASSAGAWIDIVHREMEKVREGRSLLRPYAATNEAEFFAVAVESFFDRPRALRERHPELYGALAQFFNQDPAAMSPGWE